MPTRDSTFVEHPPVFGKLTVVQIETPARDLPFVTDEGILTVISAGDESAVVGDQTIAYGALTLASAGGAKALDSNGDEVDFVSVDDQTGATRTWSVSSGRLIANGTPGVDDTVVLICTTTLGVIDVTIASVADAYSFASLTEAQTLSATAAATIAGKTLLARPGTYSGQLQFSGKAYGSVVTLSSHAPVFEDASALEIATSRAKFTSSGAYTIEVLNTNNLTIENLEVENTSTNNGTDHAIRVRGPTSPTSIIIQDNWIHGGLEYDPNGDYDAAGSAGNPTGIGGDGNRPTDFTIQRNLFTDLWVAVGMGAKGFMRFHDNYVDRFYYDATSWEQLADSTELSLKRNVITRPCGMESDAASPHPDCFQGNMLTGTSPDDDWTGIVAEQNIVYCGDARGKDILQGFFFGEDAGANYISNPIFRANLIILGGSVHGISIEALKDGEFYNNTIVRQNTGAGSFSPGIQLGMTGSVPLIAGTQTMYGNIAEVIGIKSGSTVLSEREIVLGAAGATIPYSDVFDGPAFNTDVGTRAVALSRFAMLFNGDADIDDSGSATLYDAGAVGSGYSTFPTNVLDATGAALNAAYEESSEDAMALVSLNGLMRWPGLVSALVTPALATEQSVLDSAGEYLAYVFQAKEDMVISHVGFRPGAVAGSPTVDVRIETVGTDGIPTGTLWATNSNIVSATLVSNTFALSALTASATITKGQWYAVKIVLSTGTSVIVSRFSGPRAAWTNSPYVITNVSGSAVKSISASGHCIALGSSATAFYCVENSFPASTVTNSNFNNTSSARRGLRFQVPFICRAAGISFWNSTSAGDFNAVIYDDAGTELSSSSTAVDGDNSALSTAGAMSAIFDSPVELTPGTWYRAAIEPSSATNVSLSVATLPSLNYRSAWPHGLNAHYTTYVASSWTDSATDQLPLMDILIDQLGAPS